MSNNLLLTKRGGFDEMYTPKNGVQVLLKHMKPNSKVLCPFDDFSSNYFKVLIGAGHTVTTSHQWDGKDFFDYTEQDVREYDYIISNPPYSIKDKVIEHLYNLNKPFAMLLPIVTLAGVKRNKMFYENGIQILVIDKRINFMKEKGSSSYFNTSYFCKDFLEHDLMFTKLPKDVE